MTMVNRREALAFLLSAPLAAPAALVRAQTRASAKQRVVLGAGHGLLVEPDGSVQIWHRGGFNGLDAILGFGPQGSLPPTRSRKCRA